MNTSDTYEYKYEAEAIAEHERLSKLFKENRFMFELERKKAIEKTINQIERKRLQTNLRQLQEKWDNTLNHSGSAQNRFVMVQTMLWDAVHNQWLPALNK
ncbi:MAG: DUF3135 domain-containing protein [Desulfobacterales bacterium]|nr:DUF3135 domain-containing protein [Desulfobacterales bacterium]